MKKFVRILTLVFVAAVFVMCAACSTNSPQTNDILYTQLHSNAMNGLGTGASITTKLAYWKIVLIVVNVVVVVGFAVWGTVVILQSKRKNKS